MVPTSDLDDVLPIEFVLAQSNHLFRQLYLGVVEFDVGNARSGLAHGIQAPAPDIALIVNSEGGVIASTDNDRFAGSRSENDALRDSPVGSSAVDGVVTNTTPVH